MIGVLYCGAILCAEYKENELIHVMRQKYPDEFPNPAAEEKDAASDTGQVQGKSVQTEVEIAREKRNHSF
jgi:hypothetical protein